MPPYEASNACSGSLKITVNGTPLVQIAVPDATLVTADPENRKLAVPDPELVTSCVTMYILL
jgi:hypothetical protein